MNIQKKFYTKLLFVILGILALGTINSFFGFLTNFTLALFFLFIFTVIYFIYKIPKSIPEYEQTAFNVSAMVALIYFALTYFLGLFLGFVRNSGALRLENIVTVVISIILAELTRYILVDKSQRKWWITSLIIVTFVVLDLTLRIPSLKFSDSAEILKFMFVFLLPSISSNILFTYLAKKGNFKNNIIYRFIMELPMYLIPISPDLGSYMTGVFGICVPMILILLIHKITRVERDEIVDRSQKNFINIITGVFVAVTVVIVGVFSGWFKYQFIAIATDSMSPSINIGDAIIVEKLSESEQKNLTEGDILIFKKENIIIVHRITNINKANDNLFEYTTKGDANNSEDSFKVIAENIIGHASLKIPYFGWPTIWLNEKITNK